MAIANIFHIIYVFTEIETFKIVGLLLRRALMKAENATRFSDSEK